jgi:hypothetical protein
MFSRSRFVLAHGVAHVVPSLVNLTPEPFTIIGFGTPGREDGQHPIAQAIHGCFMARGRGSYSLFVCLLCSNPLGAAVSRVQAPLHRRSR